MTKQKLKTKEEDKKNFEGVLGLFFDSCKSWLNSETKKVITSVLSDRELDLDIEEQVRKENFFRSLFGGSKQVRILTHAMYQLLPRVQ